MVDSENLVGSLWHDDRDVLYSHSHHPHAKIFVVLGIVKKEDHAAHWISNGPWVVTSDPCHATRIKDLGMPNYRKIS